MTTSNNHRDHTDDRTGMDNRWILRRQDGEAIDTEGGVTWLDGGDSEAPNWATVRDWYDDPDEPVVHFVAERVRIVDSQTASFGTRLVCDRPWACERCASSHRLDDRDHNR